MNVTVTRPAPRSYPDVPVGFAGVGPEYNAEGVLVLRAYPGGDCWLISLPSAAGSVAVRGNIGAFARALVRRRIGHDKFVIRHAA